MSTFTFQSGQVVINLIPGDRMTAGRAYRVHSSYHGHSGCGAQEWCRVADDTGSVVGFDPDRFIAGPAEGLTPNRTVCEAALRSRRTLSNLLAEFRGESLGVLRKKLQGLFDDATAMVAETAQEPARNQVTFHNVSSSISRAAEPDVTLKVQVGVGATPVGWMRYFQSSGAYRLTVGAQQKRLQGSNYEQATEECRQFLVDLAGGDREDLAFWASVQAAQEVAA